LGLWPGLQTTALSELNQKPFSFSEEHCWQLKVLLTPYFQY
jgi:hypothetical protein